MPEKNLVIGVDYGTDSVRALIVDVHTGEHVASAVHPYSRWAQGRYCDPAANRFRQHPLDYIEGLENSVREALAQAPAHAATRVLAISVDTTGSTPVAVNREGTPLALTPEFADNPNAMFILWKDHTATAEADLINRTARTWSGTDFTMYEGEIGRASCRERV
jgi:L-ribulokinase